MVGRVMERVCLSHPRTARRNRSPAEVGRRLTGREVVNVGRHGKLLLIGLGDGQTMVAHLGMSGRFSVCAAGADRAPHTHFVAALDDGAEVRFIDPRTFGFVAVRDESEPDPAFSRLGPDAWLDAPEPPALVRALAGRVAPLKALLLDQRIIAGLGNIYADEALHRAGIHPLRPGGRLSEAEACRLLDATRAVLERAIDSGGTTLGDLAYLLPDGRAGENLARLKVYGREGEPCLSCGAPVERTAVRARSTHFCPGCQT